MALNQPNANGQTTSANSSPVVIASDQSVLSFKNTTGLAATTGTITTATSTVTATNMVGVGSVTVTMAGTYAGVNISFEIFDGTNWIGVTAIQTNSATAAPVVSSGALTNNTVAWNVSPLLGVSQFRVRATAWTSGTANIIIMPSAQFVPMNLGAAATQVGTWTMQPGNTANTTPWLVRTPATTTSSGLLINKVLTAAATTPVLIKASAAQIYGWHFANNATSARYVRFFNVATSPTMGTTSPTFVIPLPAGGGAVLDPNALGIPMATGIYYSITAGAADLDNTAPAANDVVGTIFTV